MLTLLSPAKKMKMDPAQTALAATRPRFEPETKMLAIKYIPTTGWICFLKA